VSPLGEIETITGWYSIPPFFRKMYEMKSYLPTFEYSKIKVEDETIKGLPEKAIKYLQSFGINI